MPGNKSKKRHKASNTNKPIKPVLGPSSAEAKDKPQEQEPPLPISDEATAQGADEHKGEVEARYSDELVRLASGGDAQAQVALADAYYIGEGVERNNREAVKWYRKAADQGNAEACNCLGNAWNER